MILLVNLSVNKKIVHLKGTKVEVRSVKNGEACIKTPDGAVFVIPLDCIGEDPNENPERFE